MAKELYLPYGTTGLTVYAVIRDSSGQYWNGTSFESFNQSHLSSYKVAMTEEGTSGNYSANFPAVSAGIYDVQARIQSGGSPAWTDATAGTDLLTWGGSSLSSGGSIDTSTVSDLIRDEFDRISFSPNTSYFPGTVGNRKIAYNAGGNIVYEDR